MVAVRTLAESRSSGQKTFRQFRNERLPGFTWNWHHDMLADELQALSDRDFERLIITVPPGTGKTLTASMLFPAFELARRPHHKVLSVSNSGKIVKEISRSAKQFYEENGGALSQDTQSKERWNNPFGGCFTTASITSSVLSVRANAIGIDDPFPNAGAARSQTERDKIYAEISTTIATRMELNPDVPNIMWFIMQRLHHEDLVGTLMENDAKDASKWRLVDLPAYREPKKHVVFSSGLTVAPDPREQGEFLWPEATQFKELADTFREAHPDWFHTAYQQDPPEGYGGEFKRSWFVGEDASPNADGSWEGEFVVDKIPTDCVLVRGWDEAATKEGGDFTAGVLVGWSPSTGLHYMVDMVHGQWSPGTRDSIMRKTWREDQRRYYRAPPLQYCQREGGSSGKDREATLALYAAEDGVRFAIDSPSGDKGLRANNLSSRAESGNVRMVKGAWNSAFLKAAVRFPDSPDDEIDAGSWAFNRLMASPPSFSASRVRNNY